MEVLVPKTDPVFYADSAISLVVSISSSIDLVKVSSTAALVHSLFEDVPRTNTLFRRCEYSLNSSKVNSLRP